MRWNTQEVCRRSLERKEELNKMGLKKQGELFLFLREQGINNLEATVRGIQWILHSSSFEDTKGCGRISNYPQRAPEEESGRYQMNAPGKRLSDTGIS